MKKILIYLLMVTLVFSMLTGCKKKDEAAELDLGEIAKDNEGEVVEAINDAGNQEETVDEVEYILYLRYKDKPFLYDELFSVNINDESFKEKSIEEFILDKLIGFSGQGELISPVPKGTKVLSIERQGKNVTVNLSKEFLEKKMSSSDATLTIGGIVNSIVAIPGNETAQIMVEGKLLETYNGMKTAKPMHFLEGVFPDK